MLTLTDGGRVAAQSMKPLLVQVSNTIAEVVPVRTVLPVTRVLTNGTTVPDFAVPAGRMLILTDVVGVVRPGIPWTAGFAAALSVRTNLPQGPTLQVYEPLTPEAVSAEVAVVREHLQSGFTVGPNLNVCLSAQLQHGFGGGVLKSFRPG